MEESQELEKLPRVVTGVLKSSIKFFTYRIGCRVDYCFS